MDIEPNFFVLYTCNKARRQSEKEKKEDALLHVSTVSSYIPVFPNNPMLPVQPI